MIGTCRSQAMSIQSGSVCVMLSLHDAMARVFVLFCSYLLTYIQCIDSTGVDPGVVMYN